MDYFFAQLLANLRKQGNHTKFRNVSRFNLDKQEWEKLLEQVKSRGAKEFCVILTN